MNIRPILTSLLVAATLSHANGSSPFTKSGSNIVHQRSGVVFPVRVGSFQRSFTQMYDRVGADVSVRYYLDHSVHADVYSYPATKVTGNLDSEFRRQQSAINQLNGKVKLIALESTQVNQDGRVVGGKHATYNVERPLFGRDRVQAESQLFVFRDGAWFVAYRFSYPRAQAPALRKPISDFVERWIWKPRGRVV